MAPSGVDSLAARLRIPPQEVKRRMKVAARIRPRRHTDRADIAARVAAWPPALDAGTMARTICG